MVGFIPEETINRVLEAIEIEDVIGDYVALKRKGKYLVGLCPFHAEKSPSFSVTPDKQIFYCFGCQAGGNVFKFLMLREDLTFPEAVAKLADRAGIPLPTKDSELLSPQVKERQRLTSINELVMKYYHHFLRKESNSGLDYFRNRGLSDDIIDKFSLGYSQDAWDSLYKFLRSRQINSTDLERLGLIVPNKKGGYFDVFRHRVIFPIWDQYNKVVGFGGRIIGEGQPKYLNSPETDLFSKGRTLYGLNFATQGIRNKNKAIIMEGYLDVITAHQHSVTNVVGTLGTALTSEHAKLLAKYTKNVVMCFDGDSAGIRAAFKSLDVLQLHGFNVEVLLLPDGKDPDDYIKSYGGQKFELYLEEKVQNLMQFKVTQMISQTDLSSIGQKFELLQQVLPNLDRASNQVELEEFIKAIGQGLDLTWESIVGELRKFQRDKEKNSLEKDINVKKRYNNYDNSQSVTLSGQQTPKKSADAKEKAEVMLLAILLEDSDYYDKVKDKISWNGYENKQLGNILRLFEDIKQDKGKVIPQDLFSKLDDKANSFISLALLEEIDKEKLEETLEDCVTTLTKANTKARKNQIIKEIAAAERAGNITLVKELMSQLQQML